MDDNHDNCNSDEDLGCGSESDEETYTGESCNWVGQDRVTGTMFSSDCIACEVFFLI